MEVFIMKYFEKVESELTIKLEKLLELDLNHGELLAEIKNMGYTVHGVFKYATKKKISEDFTEFSNVYITTEEGEIGMKYYRFYYDFEDLAYKNFAKGTNPEVKEIIVKRNIETGELYLIDYRVTDMTDEGLHRYGAQRFVLDMVTPSKYIEATCLDYVELCSTRCEEEELNEITEGLSEEEKQSIIKLNNMACCTIQGILKEGIIELVPEEYKEPLKAIRDFKCYHGKVKINGRNMGYRIISGDYVAELSIDLAKNLLSSQQVGMSSAKEFNEEYFKSIEVHKFTMRDFNNDTPEFQKFVETVLNRGLNLMTNTKIGELSDKILNGEIKFNNKVVQNKMEQLAKRKFGCSGVWF